MGQVRFAQMQDIPALIELGRQIHVQSRYAGMQFNAICLWACLKAAIVSKQHCVIVAADSGREIDAGAARFTGILWACALGLFF